MGQALSGLRDPAVRRCGGRPSPSLKPTKAALRWADKMASAPLRCAAPGARGGGASARLPSNCTPHQCGHGPPEVLPPRVLFLRERRRKGWGGSMVVGADVAAAAAIEGLLSAAG